MSAANNVDIYNEANTATVAQGYTADNGNNVTNLTAAVVPGRAYVLHIAGRGQRGTDCTGYSAQTNTATFV